MHGVHGSGLRIVEQTGMALDGTCSRPWNLTSIRCADEWIMQARNQRAQRVGVCQHRVLSHEHHDVNPVEAFDCHLPCRSVVKGTPVNWQHLGARLHESLHRAIGGT